MKWVSWNDSWESFDQRPTRMDSSWARRRSRVRADWFPTTAAFRLALVAGSNVGGLLAWHMARGIGHQTMAEALGGDGLGAF